MWNKRIIAEIKNSLVCPNTALQILYEDYQGKWVPKGFIKQALDDIEEVVRLLKLLNDD